jgi:hypothetical protein
MNLSFFVFPSQFRLFAGSSKLKNEGFSALYDKRRSFRLGLHLAQFYPVITKIDFFANEDKNFDEFSILLPHPSVLAEGGRVSGFLLIN